MRLDIFVKLLFIFSSNVDIIEKVKHEADDYMVSINSLKPDEKTKRCKSVHELFSKAKDLSDDKVQLAMQTYEMVDKHIRRLDSELQKLESEIKEKQSGSGQLDQEPASKKRGGGRNRDKKTLALTQDNEQHKETENPILAITAQPNEVLDMPVDPNEPTYCTCHQVSYGEMIGCDNQECPIEWFHFGCVGLVAKPKGKWYCPKCTTDRKKK